MKKIPKTGKAQYEIDTKTKTYWYHGRNPEKISKGEEERNGSENLLKRRFLFGIIIR
jgi:hypothetical protein